MSTARKQLAVVGETMFPPRTPFFLRAWGTSRFSRGGTHGSPTSPLLLRRARNVARWASRPDKPASGLGCVSTAERRKDVPAV